MTNKLITGATLLCLLAIALVGHINPTDPLFAFVSIEQASMLFKLGLVAAMVSLTFLSLAKNAVLRASLAIVGLGLLSFGAVTLLVNPFGAALYEFLKPLDLLLVMEAGIIFTISAIDKQIEPKYQSTGSVKVPVKVSSTRKPAFNL